jgi:predicted proteasome-type protease
LGIVKTTRLVASKAGEVLDVEDQKLLKQGFVLSAAVLSIAGILGTAVRLFLVTSGIF